MVWVDPENELLFVFLSNRVLPNSNNNAINTMRVRARVYEAFVNAML
jgi:CubicO group peptidase (beta-lactamase class C family)